MFKLCELPWFDGLYKSIYDVLSVEGKLPHPCDITILPPEAVEVRETVQAATWVDARTIWFRHQPPSYTTFAHELIHLVSGKPVEFEEAYAYNLAAFAVLLAERGIVPPASVVRLFEVSLSEIMDAIREVYRYPFKDIVEYFEYFGIIPAFVVFKENPLDDSWKLEIDWQRYNEKTIVVATVAELVGMAEYDEFALDVLLKLLERASRSSTSAPSKPQSSNPSGSERRRPNQAVLHQKVGVYLDEETMRQIAELAEAYGISYSAVVRLAVRELYKKIKPGGRG